MPSSSVLNFTDPAEYQRSVRAAQVQLFVTARGAFDAKLTKIDLNRLLMQRARISLPAVTHSSLSKPRSMIFLQFDPDQRPILNNGFEVAPSEIVFYPIGSEHYYRTFGPYYCGGMSLPPDDLAAYGLTLTGRELSSPTAARVIRPPAPAMSRLLGLHKAASDLAETAPEILAHPEVAKAIEQELVRTMITCLSDLSVEPARAPNWRRLQIMRKFEQMLQNRQDEPLYIAEVCAEIGVTDRTLRACCQENLGMGPHRYLWFRRMNLARRALTMADPRAKTVTEIANDYGFAELGRFAVAYRTLFGETPSLTLRRV